MLEVFCMMYVSVIQNLIRNLQIMNKVKILKFCLNVVKYGITLLLGYLSGDGTMSNFLNM